MTGRHRAARAIGFALAASSALLQAQPPASVGPRTNCNPGNRCAIAVDVAAGTCDVRSPAKDEAIVVAGSSGRDIRMVWTLPGNYRFCEGDGVSFIDASNQFSGGAATGDPGGGDDTGGGCKKHYRVVNRNDATGQWRYKLAFTAPNGSKCSYDPWVLNN